MSSKAKDAQKDNTMDVALRKYTDVDMKNYVPPCIFFLSRSSGEAELQPFNVSQLDYDASPRQMSHGSTQLQVRYKPMSSTLACPIRIQTPELRCIFGLSRITEGGAGSTGACKGYQLDLSLDFETSDVERYDFYRAMHAWDEANIKWLVDKQNVWHMDDSETLKAADVKRIYTAMTRIRRPKSGQNMGKRYPPSLRIKVMDKKGRPSAHFFDADRRPIEPDAIVPDSRVRVIFEHNGLWFMGKEIVCSNRAIQVQLVASPGSDVCGFVDVQATSTPTILDQDPLKVMDTQSSKRRRLVEDDNADDQS